MRGRFCSVARQNYLRFRLAGALRLAGFRFATFRLAGFRLATFRLAGLRFAAAFRLGAAFFFVVFRFFAGMFFHLPFIIRPCRSLGLCSEHFVDHEIFYVRTRLVCCMISTCYDHATIETLSFEKLKKFLTKLYRCLHFKRTYFT